MVVKPMLASEAEDIKFPVLASPKLDGIRCLIVDGVAMSRSMKPIRNKHIQSVIGKSEYNGFDGELMVGSPTADDVYRITNSGVMSTEGVPDFTFHLFDLYNNPCVASVRSDTMKKLSLGKHFTLVPQVLISGSEELVTYEQKCLDEGYEGIMVKDPKGFYKNGRATAKGGELLKVKRFADDEAEIIEVYELMHNDNPAEKDAFGRTERSTSKENLRPAGTAGGITARRPSDGAVFSIGTGYDAETRASLWADRNNLVGKLVKYKHFPLGAYDVPRFPVFLGIRDKDDL